MLVRCFSIMYVVAYVYTSLWMLINTEEHIKLHGYISAGLQTWVYTYIVMMIQTYLCSWLKTDVRMLIFKQSNTCLNSYIAFYKIAYV